MNKQSAANLPGPGPGRPKGSTNRATRDVREAIAIAAEACAPRITEWLEQVEDPSKRLDLYLKMIEYHIPKLARMEHTGEDGGPVQVVINDPTRRKS